MARKKEFRVDMHVHSKYSGESLAEPRDIVDCAIEEGMDAICITEHESLRASSPFEAFRGATPLVILRGVELNTDLGHMLVYGVPDVQWDDWGKKCVSSAQELLKRAWKLGGVVVPAHPYMILNSTGFLNGEKGRIFVNENLRQLQGSPGLAALEVCNGKHAATHPMICRPLGLFARSMGLPGTGGSDAHVPENVGLAYTVFRTPIDSDRALVAALRSGLFHPRSRAHRLRCSSG